MTLQRKSRQREIILAELRAVTSHPTAQELHALVRRRMPRVSLGTVYRNLDLLARNGLIQKLEAGGGQARFDGNPQPHVHVRCVRCRRVTDLPDVPVDSTPPRMQTLSGYEILQARIEYAGICPVCINQISPDERERVRREWQAAREGA